MKSLANLKVWDVYVTRENRPLWLGVVTETTEPYAREAALSNYGVADDEPFERFGINADDDFSVTEA
jgi:hypothetical protein